MISEAVQSRIRQGDKKAFMSLYDAQVKRVYLVALDELGDEDAARRVVKQAFLLLRRDMMETDGAIDVEARLDALTMQEIDMQRLLHGGIDDMLAAQERAVEQGRAAALYVPPQPRAAAPAEPAPQMSETPRELRPLQAQPAGRTATAYAEPEEETVSEDELSSEEPMPVSRGKRRKADAMERVREHMREDGEVPREDLPPRQTFEMRRRRRRSVNALITALIVLLSIALMWIVVGILMDFEVLPFVDLGYVWFNKAVFPLFRLQGAAGV